MIHGLRFCLFTFDESYYHHNDTDKQDDIKEHDGNNWSKKSTPKGSKMREKTAAKHVYGDTKTVKLVGNKV